MTDQERITALEARIAQLESRVAIAERGPVQFGQIPNQLPEMPWPQYPSHKPGYIWSETTGYVSEHQLKGTK